MFLASLITTTIDHILNTLVILPLVIFTWVFVVGLPMFSVYYLEHIYWLKVLLVNLITLEDSCTNEQFCYQ